MARIKVAGRHTRLWATAKETRAWAERPGRCALGGGRLAGRAVYVALEQGEPCDVAVDGRRGPVPLEAVVTLIADLAGHYLPAGPTRRPPEPDGSGAGHAALAA